MESITWRSIPTNQTSMKPLCEYCGRKINNKHLLRNDPSYDIGISVLLYRDELKIDVWHDARTGLLTHRIKVHFCPMCGTKLV
jgi:hypothetical protein